MKHISAKTKRQIILFIIVGAINTLFSYVAFALFIYLGFNYVLAAVFATCAGIIFNFNTTGRIVFQNTRKSLIVKFISVYAFLFVLNVMLLNLFQYFSKNYYITEFVAVFPLATAAFLLNKFIVFKEAS